jgi:VWFA-related protein
LLRRPDVRTRAALPIVLAVVALTAGAQAPEKPPSGQPPANRVGGLHFVDATEVTVVEIDVAVSEKGKPVSGLTKADFEVFQNGKQQEITNFYAYQRRIVGAEPEAAPTPRAEDLVGTPEPADIPPPPKPRFIVFYVDNENITPFNRNRVLTKVNDFVRENLRPPDQAMVASYQRSLKIAQTFTSDPQEIVDALRGLRTYTGGRVEVNSARKDIEEYINSESERSNTSADPLTQATDRAKSFAREQRNTLVFTIRALQELVGMMTGLPGKKAIIYVSDGLPWTPGLELFYEIQDVFRDTSSISDSREFDSIELYRGLITTAAAADVTFYTIDARGLEAELGIEAENRTARSPIGAQIARSNYQDSLSYMADQTGGLAILNSNDVSAGLEKIAEDFETYYSLGYRLVPSGQDRMHRIEVKFKGDRKLTLKYRRFFTEKTLGNQIADRVISGLTFQLPENPLGIEVTTGEPAPASSGRWTLPVDVRIPIERLALIPDGDQLAGYVTVYYAARDTEGKQSDLQTKEHAVKIPQAEYETARTKYYTISASLLLEPGRYRISIGTRDQLTNQAGYATVSKAVHPDKT